MKLVDLDPAWCDAGGDGIKDRNGNPVPYQRGIGLICCCPCGCKNRLFVPFANPLDNSAPRHDERSLWHRTGDTFETLTLTPSIHRVKEKGGCGWHGWIRNGEIVTT